MSAGRVRMASMSEEVIPLRVTPEARAKVIRSALGGRLVRSKLTAGQRRAVEVTRKVY